MDTKDGVDPETKADTVTDRKEATRAGDPKVSGVDMVDQVVMVGSHIQFPYDYMDAGVTNS